MKRLVTTMIIVLMCFTVAFAYGEAEPTDDSFVFLDKITWTSSIEEIDQVMSDLGIERHSAYSFWASREVNEGKNDRYLPYQTHGIFGGSGKMIGFTTGINQVGLEEIAMDFEASSIGFKNVYNSLCAEYGDSYRFGMMVYKDFPSNSAYVWETKDAYILLYAYGSGLFSDVEKGKADFGISIIHTQLPDNFVFTD